MNITSYGDAELEFKFHQCRGTAWLMIREGNSEFILYAGRYVTAAQLRQVSEILNEPIEPPDRTEMTDAELAADAGHGTLDDEIPF
jgi:hypothetical protein